MEQRGGLHIVSIRELGIVKQSGSSKIRARCPVHNGSSPNLAVTIACDNLDHAEGKHDTECNAGLGYCFTAGCNATVLVAEVNPQKALHLGYKVEGGDLLALRAMVKANPDNGRARDELLTLHGVYPHAKKAISYYERAKAYLSQRGIPLDTAVEYGLAYIPAISAMKNHAEIDKMQKYAKWCDRILFPCITPNGEQGYTGRALHLWQVGMNEDEHKKLLDAYNEDRRAKQWREMRRWEKTNPVGYFNYAAVESADKLVLVEGQFDALALLASGIRDVIPMGNARMPSEHIPTRICDVVIALDGDQPGKDGAKQLARELRRKGISVEVALPMGGKDWSELYRLHGKEGVAPVHAFFTQPSKVEDEHKKLLCTESPEATVELDEDDRELQAWLSTLEMGVELCSVCYEQGLEVPALAKHPYENNMYCKLHHPLGIVAVIERTFGKCEIDVISPDTDLVAYKSARMREIVARERAKDEQLKLANRRKAAFRR